MINPASGGIELPVKETLYSSLFDLAFSNDCQTSIYICFTPNQYPGPSETPGGRIGSVIRIVVLLKTQFEITCMSAIVAAGRLALKYVYLVCLHIFPR